jgi:acyl transferase domain-containing protein
VSCHGIGGSNAHVVLESFESASDSPPTVLDSTSNPDYLFIFAAANEASITRWKDALISYYKDVTDHRSLRSLSHDLARLSRSLPARAFAVGPAMSSGLELSKHATVGPNMNPKLCLVFSGQGPQHASMGKVLSLVYPAFWHSVKSSDEILVQKYGRESFLNRSGLFVPEVKVNLPEDGVWPVQDVVYSIVFVQLALVELLQSLGIKYDYVMGHR